MEKEFENLLEETKEVLNSKKEIDKDDLHSKVLGLYVYLDTGQNKNTSSVEEYNKIVEECKNIGVKKIKKYKVKERKTEQEVMKKREEGRKNEETEKLAVSILEHSKTLKKRTEAFGTMLDLSKDLLDKVSSSVRKNVHNVEKGVETLEKQSWWTLTTKNTIGIVLLVLLVFILMYIFIRIS